MFKSVLIASVGIHMGSSTQKCCSELTLTDSSDHHIPPKTYTLFQGELTKELPTGCVDGCVYEYEGKKYCMSEGSKYGAVCEEGSGGSCYQVVDKVLTAGTFSNGIIIPMDTAVKGT